MFSLGRFFGAKVDSQKKLKRHMVFWEGSLVRRSTHKKRLETPHGFLGRFFGAKVDSQKNWKRHMVFWEGSLVRSRLTKKT